MQKGIKYGVIPAAGKGTRMGYISRYLPKCLLPLGGEPILRYVISQMERVGVEKIFIIVNSHKEKVVDYVENTRDEISPEIKFIEQKELKGTGHAVLLAEKHIDKPFIVIWGDDFTFGDSLKGMVEKFFKEEAVVVKGMVKEKDEEILKNTCCAELGEQGEIKEIIEKPDNPPYNIRGCGLLVFSPEIFSYFKKNPVKGKESTLDVVYTVSLLAKEGRAYGYMLQGENININRLEDLVRANNIFLGND